MRSIHRALSIALLLPAVGAAGACSSTNTAKPASDAGPMSTGDAKAPPPPAAGGTGAFGIVTINGKQKMYLPQDSPTADGKFVIAVVDVGAAGNGVIGAPAQITTIPLTDPEAGFDFSYATATGGDSSMVIAASTDFPKIWFIDPTTDTLVKTLTLDMTMYGMSSFSGGGGFVTGIAIDSANHRAILSVWNGFAIVDLGTQTITSVIQAPPSENFGFDSAHQRIIAPFYECSSSSLQAGGAPSTCDTPKAPDGTTMTDGLSIIDLTDNTVYTYQYSAGTDDAGNPILSGPTPQLPVGGDPDSAAADPTTGVIVVPSESDSFQSVIDLSMATFDKATKTVTAPQKVIPNLGLTGVAIEYNQHLAFWEEEHSSDVAVANLTQANTGVDAVVHGLMPDLPGGTTGFSNLGDPHGIAVTTAILGNGPVGFVVDSGKQWVARVDLAKMVAAGVGSDAATTELDSAAMAPFVTYLDANTKE
jgi:hypothetical protein